MNTYLRFNSEDQVDGTPFIQTMYDIIRNGACQCNKDCDCAQSEGLIVGQHSKYRHPLSTKSFDTLMACQQSYDAAKDKIISDNSQQP